MSLALLQGYSSCEDEDEQKQEEDLFDDSHSSEDDEDGGGGGFRRPGFSKRAEGSVFDEPGISSNSLLPSALDAFHEVSVPPEFLNNASSAVAAQAQEASVEIDRRRKRNKSRDKKDLPAGAVLESKPQLVAIRDRVRSDVEGVAPPTSAGAGIAPDEGKRVVTASNPEAKDAAELLRMCPQCGIPKTYSHTKGMVCPQCGDRPPPDPTNEPEKKKGSIIKDKEKSKRMRGQSSHSTWKSETEMHLRQQFD